MADRNPTFAAALLVEYLTIDRHKDIAGRCFLATYRPLVRSSSGRQAIREHALPPFIDGSCRREPDFESSFPSITATCRGGNFAPRLQGGDRIAYLTVKGQYLDDAEPGWRLVAVLRVVQRFASHDEAAAWYRREARSLPSNCLVEANPPKAFELSNGDPPKEVRERMAGESDPVRAVRLWDATYRQRVAKWPVFLATQADFIELNHPPHLGESQMRAIFGRVPSTLNPPRIACRQLEALVQLATGR
jgi:hypothetical protein